MAMVHESPKVSVLLPTYNGAQFVGEAIESILNQSFSDFELLIIDDGSTDATVSIVSSFSQKDSRIKVSANEENLGLFANYNCCIKKARGEYLKPFAQDDLLERHALAEMTRVLDAECDVAVVSCARQCIDHCGKPIEVVRRYNERRKLEADQAIAENLFAFANGIGEPCAVMFRRSHAGDGFRTDFFHYGDIEYWLRLLQNGSYVFLPEALTCFRRHGGSGTQRNYESLRVVSDVWKLAHTYEDFAVNHGLSKEEFYILMVENLASQVYQSTNNFVSCPEKLWQTDVETLDASALKELLARSLMRLAKYLHDQNSLVERLTARIAELDGEKEELQAEIEKFQRSFLWQAIRPVRYLARTFIK